MDESCQIAAPFTMRVSIPEGILYRELDGEVALLSVENEFYYSLNSIGTRMWYSLVEQGDVETVCQELLKTLLVDEVRLRRDLANLINQLCQEGLLVVTHADGADAELFGGSLSGVVLDSTVSG